MEENVGNDDTKTFRRDLKKAKVFAIHYLTRRIRLLKNKKGIEQQIEKNKRKAERFQEEIECIKDLHVNIVLKKIQENLDISDIIKEGSQDVQERALARLMSSKPIQNRMKDTTDKNISSQPHSVDVLSSSKIRCTNCEKPNLKKSNNHNPPSKQETIICSDEAVSETFNSSEENSDEEIERTATSFFVKSMASLADDGGNKSSKNERKAKEVKKASNRLGQRARRRIWKETYGDKADHVKLDEKIKTTRKYEKLKPDKRSKQATKSKAKQTSQETVTHPSWEASKRRKLEQNISQTQFQGKKITFEDSD